MRKLLLILTAVSFVAASCTDKDYDLADIDDNFAIGDTESEFYAPLATLSLHATSFTNNTAAGKETIIEVYEEADIWLPTTLPNGADFVDVQRLMNDDAYLDTVVRALIAEMEASETKATDVCNLIAKRHKAEYLATIKGHISTEEYNTLEAASPEQSAVIIKQLFDDNHKQALDTIVQICKRRLSDLTFDDVVYNIPPFDVSDDIRDMITDNIGNKGDVSNPNKLFIAGSVDSNFPFDIIISPKIENTSIVYNNLQLYYGKEEEMPEQQIYVDDIETLFNGTRAIIEFTIERYYPRKADIDKCEANIDLHLRKKGYLTL